MTKYFLYARKSTDEDDRQILSIESQLFEIRQFAQRERLEIVEEFIESRTAKEPGRPVFNSMVSKVEDKPGSRGILAWHPDRLARNSVDGGKIIYLVDKVKIESLKFPTFWFENSPQGKFMLNIAFGQSKYFVDNLSENVHRGIRQKLRRGELPGLAPIGYLNDLRNHTIVTDSERSPLIVKLFEAYSTGEHSVDSIRGLSQSLGLFTRRNGSPLSRSEVHRILLNPFYYGMFMFRGELHQGSHEPILSKQLFDRVQRVLVLRGKPRSLGGLKPFLYRNFFTCGECGRMITAESHRKKSGLTFTYYRCTKKGTTCHQKYLEEKKLYGQVDSYVKKVALKDGWAGKMLGQLEKDKRAIALGLDSRLRGNDGVKGLRAVENKLKRLLEAHLSGDLEIEEYRNKKKELLEKKVSLKERMDNLRRGTDCWLEPMREWVLSCQNARKLGSYEEKKAFLRKIGSNFILAGQRIRFSVSKPYDLFFPRLKCPNWGG